MIAAMIKLPLWWPIGRASSREKLVDAISWLVADAADQVGEIVRRNDAVQLTGYVGRLRRAPLLIMAV